MFRISGLAFVVAASILTIACGQSKTIVSPATADAQNFPGGVVQFSATGISHPTWCIGSSTGMCNGNVASVATINSNGSAQCVSGTPGTVTILAGRSGNIPKSDDGFQLSNFGSAQLTCP